MTARAWRRWAAAVAVAAVALAWWTGRRVGGYGDGPEAALHRWADFPVQAQRRPLVLLSYGEGVTVTEDPAYEYDVWDRPWYRRHWVLAEPAQSPRQVGGFPVISAEAAFGLVTAREPGRETDPRPLRVRTRLGTETFTTDRGTAALPVWRFAFPEGAEASALAVPRSAVYFSLPGTAGYDPDGVLTSSGDELVYRFTGPPLCGDRKVLRVRESPTAVAFKLWARNTGTDRRTGLPAYDVRCPTDVPQTLRVRLERPLGDRVVVDYYDGSVIQVRPEPRERRLT